MNEEPCACRTFGDYMRFIRGGVILLVVVALIRFSLSVSGFPQSIGTHLASLTYVGLLLALYYGYKAARSGFGRYRQLLFVSLMVATGRGALILLGILVSALSGIATYYHPEGVPMGGHLIAHAVEILPATLLFWGLGALVFRFTGPAPPQADPAA